MTNLNITHPSTIDFVEQLPLEIIAHAFSYLDTEQKVECLNVCRRWHERLVSCDVLWYTIELTSANHNGSGNSYIKQLYPLAPKVKHVALHEDYDFEKEAFEWLSTCHFKNLLTLGNK